jgi:hypothetical protein
MGIIMRFLKLIIASVIVLFLVVTFLFALFPSTIRVSRVIAISSSLEKTSAVINNLNTWSHWNHFVNDSFLTNTYVSSPANGKGAFLKSDQFRILVTGSSIDSMSTQWTKTDGRSFSGQMLVIPSGPGNVVLQWYFDFHFRWYPWEKLGAMFYDKQLGPIMEKSLDDLKNYVEKNP